MSQTACTVIVHVVVRLFEHTPVVAHDKQTKHTHASFSHAISHRLRAGSNSSPKSPAGSLAESEIQRYNNNDSTLTLTVDCNSLLPPTHHVVRVIIVLQYRGGVLITRCARWWREEG